MGLIRRERNTPNVLCRSLKRRLQSPVYQQNERHANGLEDWHKRIRGEEISARGREDVVRALRVAAGEGSWKMNRSEGEGVRRREILL